MSKKRVVAHAILAVLSLIGTYVYFWALDFLNTNLGVNISQAVDRDVLSWQFTVWVMSIMLAAIVVFIGAAKGHPNLEPIASGGYLAFTIASFFIGCSILTLNFPYTGFGSSDVLVTIDPSMLMSLFGGGGPIPMPPITINVALVQLLVTTMSMIYAVLQFLRTLLKSRREPETSETPSASTVVPKEMETLDFMRNVRKE
nr:hypothetical protein [Candidatus Sigynarchaeota archaeon]